jgi:uncharacterized protein
MSADRAGDATAIRPRKPASGAVQKPGAPDGLYVCNLTRQSFLSLNLKRADSSLKRLRGLLGRIRLRSDEGLWIVPSQGIHTIGLLFPIDVIYLDAQFRVIHLVENLGPLRIGPLRLGSSSVLELPTRTIYSSNTQLGDSLLICSPEEMVAYWNTRKETG